MLTRLPRSVALLVATLLIVTLPACDSGVSQEEGIDIPFHELTGYLLNPVFEEGTYVIRTQAEWEAASPFRMPDAQPISFADSLVLAISYGGSGCLYEGGEFHRIVHRQNVVLVTFRPLTRLNPPCLATIPFQHLVQVPASAVSPYAEIVFEIPDIQEGR